MNTSVFVERVFRFIFRTIKFALISCLLLMIILLVNTILHMKFHFCVRHFAHFEQKAMRAIVYGYPTGTGLEKSKSGEIVLGGCVSGPFASVCPFCNCPAEFVKDAPDEGAAKTNVYTKAAP